MCMCMCMCMYVCVSTCVHACKCMRDYEKAATFNPLCPFSVMAKHLEHAELPHQDTSMELYDQNWTIYIIALVYNYS